MVVSRRVALVLSGLTAGVGLLTVLVMAPLAIGSASAATVAGGCRATAHIDSQWGSGADGGEIVSVTVTNTAVTTGTTWSVSWALGSSQRILNAWNATVTTSSGTATAVNLQWNGTLAPGASTSFGMQLAGSGAAPLLTCGNDAITESSSPPRSSPPNSSPPAGAGDVNVTEADSQTTITMLVGQTLGVSLPAAYRPITASGSALTAVSTSGGYPTGQPLAALYRAVSVGVVNLSTQTDDPCFYATPPCARPVRLWTVRVNVVNPNGHTVTVNETDNNRTVSLGLGDTLVVNLPSMYRPTTVTPAGVLAQKGVAGGYPTGQPLVAQYVAVTWPGQADVSTVSDNTCLHQSPPCAIAQVSWKVHVVVTDTSPPPASGTPVVVTEADNNKTISLHVGDTLAVRLAAMYQAPTVTPAGVLTLESINGGYPNPMPLVANYRAAAPGQADVTTLSDAACNHDPMPCPSPQVRWTIHVTVTA